MNNIKVAIIDAEIIGKSKHRFPNLACMKISAWCKQNGMTVMLKTNYNDLDQFDEINISKVFTKTEVPQHILELSNVQYGGTGFYYDKAPVLPNEIEHIMPDYHLYDDWIDECIQNGANPKEFIYYKNYSIGFTTRGCFRKCKFCVNQNSHHSVEHSPLSEFVDLERKKICLLDDNFFACSKWDKILKDLHNIKKPFQFKQGLDERLLTDEKCDMLFNSKYDGEYIFAFDNIEDSELVKEQLVRIRRFTNKILKFYTICAFDKDDKWDENFWYNDIINLFRRIDILGKQRCLPYVLKYDKYEESPYRDVYVNVARWCNQPAFFKKISFMEFCWKNGENSRAYKTVKNISDTHKEFEKLFTRKWFV